MPKFQFKLNLLAAGQGPLNQRGLGQCGAQHLHACHWRPSRRPSTTERLSRRALTCAQARKKAVSLGPALITAPLKVRPHCRWSQRRLLGHVALSRKSLNESLIPMRNADAGRMYTRWQLMCTFMAHVQIQLIVACNAPGAGARDADTCGKALDGPLLVNLLWDVQRSMAGRAGSVLSPHRQALSSLPPHNGIRPRSRLCIQWSIPAMSTLLRFS